MPQSPRGGGGEKRGGGGGAAEGRKVVGGAGVAGVCEWCQSEDVAAGCRVCGRNAVALSLYGVGVRGWERGTSPPLTFPPSFPGVCVSV